MQWVGDLFAAHLVDTLIMPGFFKCFRPALYAALLAFASCVVAEPDEQQLGAPSYPIGTARSAMSQPYRVGSWSAMEQVPGFVHGKVARGGSSVPLLRAEREPEIRYRYDGVDYTLDDYLQRRRVTALLILKDGRILVERYRYQRNEAARFLSFSMAKSITGLLIGIAHDKGLIASLDDPAEKYLPQLKGAEYGASSIRHLLRMSSGMQFTEVYNGRDDSARLNAVLLTSRPGFLEFARSFTRRNDPSGEKFNYASIESLLLGRILESASGRSVTDLTSEWIWRPLGAEQDAAWRLDAEGREGTHAFFNATLRDWGRLGLMMAADGAWNGKQIVPRGYLIDATDVARQPPAFVPGVATPSLGYGYQVWLWPLRSRTFILQGVYGQAMLVQPESGIVVVQTAVFEQPSGRGDPAPTRERGAFLSGALRSLGGRMDAF